jgi:hypothetical protein
LRTVCASADRALERARARWQAGQAAVQAELGRLQTLRDRVEALGVGDGDADRR